VWPWTGPATAPIPRAVRYQQQESGASQTLDQCRQPFLCGGIDPLQILHRKNKRLASTGVENDVVQEGKSASLPRLWIESGQMRRIAGHVQQLEQPGRLVLWREANLTQTLVHFYSNGGWAIRLRNTAALP
jgi:hypothetical protein